MGRAAAGIGCQSHAAGWDRFSAPGAADRPKPRWPICAPGGLKAPRCWCPEAHSLPCDAHHQLALTEPGAHLTQELAVTRSVVIEDDEPLDLDALGQQC